MRKVYIRDIACFGLGAWIAWYEVTNQQESVFAWAAAILLMSGPAGLSVFSTILATRVRDTTTLSESPQELRGESSP